MAKIHWAVYVIVGLFVSILSWKLDYQRFVVFFYAGLVFVFVGIAKLIFDLIKNRADKTQSVHKARHRALSQLHHARHLKYCPKCGNVARVHDRFCSRCGAMV